MGQNGMRFSRQHELICEIYLNYYLFKRNFGDTSRVSPKFSNIRVRIINYKEIRESSNSVVRGSVGRLISASIIFPSRSNNIKRGILRTTKDSIKEFPLPPYNCIPCSCSVFTSFSQAFLSRSVEILTKAISFPSYLCISCSR